MGFTFYEKRDLCCEPLIELALNYKIGFIVNLVIDIFGYALNFVNTT